MPTRGAGGGAAKEAAPSKPAKAAAAPPPSKLSDEEYEEKRKLVIDYFNDDHDVTEAVKSVKELESPERHADLILNMVAIDGFSRRNMDWPALAKLLLALAEQSVLTAKHVLDGFRKVFDDFEDYLCDLPKADGYVGSLLAPLLANGHVTLAAVGKEMMQAGPEGEEGALVEGGTALGAFAAVLKAVEAEAPGKAGALWQESGLTLEGFMADFEREDFEKDAAKETSRMGLSFLFPLDAAAKSLGEALAGGAAAPASWVADNVPEAERGSPALVRLVYAKVLSAAVPESSSDEWESELEAMGAHAPLLKAAASGAADRKSGGAAELAAVSSVQLFCHERGHPKGLMTRLMKDLYAADVVSKRAVLQWKDDIKDATPGKQKALLELLAWLNWLETAEEEPDE